MTKFQGLGIWFFGHFLCAPVALIIKGILMIFGTAGWFAVGPLAKLNAPWIWIAERISIRALNTHPIDEEAA